MKRTFWWLALPAAVLIGCGETTTEPATTATGTTATPSPTGETPAAIDVSKISLSDSEMEQIKKLPNEEQTIALAQKVCPVGEGADEPGQPNHLGSMGMPVKVEAKGQTVFLCCKGCVAEFEAEPDKFLAKLGTAATAGENLPAPPAEASETSKPE